MKQEKKNVLDTQKKQALTILKNAKELYVMVSPYL